MSLSPESLWILLLTVAIGGLGWVIKGLKTDIENQERLFFEFIRDLPNTYLRVGAFEAINNKAEATLLRIETKLDTKFEYFTQQLALKADKKDLEQCQIFASKFHHDSHHS
jgi:hypothetical protein